MKCSSSARSRESALEVTFGLKVRIKAHDVDAVLNNINLKSGTQVEATLEDKLFSTTTARWTCSTCGVALARWAASSRPPNPNIWSRTIRACSKKTTSFSPGTSGDVLLEILCDYDKRVGT